MNTFSNIFKKSFLEGFSAGDITTGKIVVTLLVTVILAIYIFVVYYVHSKKTFYNKSFNISLALIAIITAAIILAMQSNLVISLGMVGALSIVRFRTAVKDPLDVGFLFLAIAAGLTAGAGLFFIAVLGTIAISFVFIVLRQIGRGQTTYLLVAEYDSPIEETVMELLQSGKGKLKSKATDGKRAEVTWLIRRGAEETLAELQKVEGVHKATLIAYTGDSQY